VKIIYNSVSMYHRGIEMHVANQNEMTLTSDWLLYVSLQNQYSCLIIRPHDLEYGTIPRNFGLRVLNNLVILMYILLA
jgi:hypothetical protein